MNPQVRVGIDIGSTTVKIAILNEDGVVLFSDYRRHFAQIQETLAELLEEARTTLGDVSVSAMITGSGGLTLANHLGIPFTQEVVAVATALKPAPRSAMWPSNSAAKTRRSSTSPEASTSG